MILDENNYVILFIFFVTSLGFIYFNDNIYALKINGKLCRTRYGQLLNFNRLLLMSEDADDDH